MRARVPASSANLGPGFDTLGLALNRYVVVDVEPASKLIVRSVGEGEGLAEDSSHLAARVAIDVAGTDRLAISVRSEIPIARGLGSSAALAVAAAAAAGAEDPLSVATAMDGHPDNAAASMVGGFVAAAVVKGGVHVVRLPLDVSLAFVVIVPDVHLSHGAGPPVAAGRGQPGERGVQPVPHGPAHGGHGRLPPADSGGGRGPAAPGLPQPALSGRARSSWRRWWPAVRSPRAGRGPAPHCSGSAVAWTPPRSRRSGEQALVEAGLPGQVLLLHADMDGLILDRDGSSGLYDDDK